MLLGAQHILPLCQELSILVLGFFFFKNLQNQRNCPSRGHLAPLPQYPHSAHVHWLKVPDVMKGSIEVEI